MDNNWFETSFCQQETLCHCLRCLWSESFLLVQGFAALCSLSTSARPPPHMLSGLTEQPLGLSNQVKWPALCGFILTPPFTAFQSILLTSYCEPTHQRDSAFPSMPSRTRSSLWLLQNCRSSSLINSCCCCSKVKWRLINYRKEQTLLN